MKRALYERAGVEEYWLVDPERDIVTICRRVGEAFAEPLHYDRGSALTTPLLLGLELTVDEIFS